jgi:hypothetical protein
MLSVSAPTLAEEMLAAVSAEKHVTCCLWAGKNGIVNCNGASSSDPHFILQTTAFFPLNIRFHNNILCRETHEITSLL